MDTGRKIMNLRLDLNITQRELADACGVTAGALSKIETGANNPSAAVLRRLARALGTAADYLLDETAPYPPPRPGHARRETGHRPADRVTARITRAELWLLEDLDRLGAYWREAAFAIPDARVDTIRLVRYLLQRDQLEGAREAEEAAQRIAGDGRPRTKAGRRTTQRRPRPRKKR
jgi:transcriptional regulator with XRE-family HTH domain